MNSSIYEDLRKLKICKESFEEVTVEPGYEPDTISANELALQDNRNEATETVAETVDEAEDIELSEDLVEGLESISKSNTQLSRFEEASLRLTLNQLKSYKGPKAGNMAFEHIGDAQFLKLATEDLKEKIKNFKQKTGDFIKKIWEAVVKFIRNLVGQNERLIKKVETLIEYLKKNPYDAGGELENKFDKYMFASNKQVNAEGLENCYDFLTEIYESITADIATAITDTEGKTPEDYRAAVIGEINNFIRLAIKDISVLNKDSKKESDHPPKERKVKDINGREGVTTVKYDLSDTWTITINDYDGIKEISIHKVNRGTGKHSVNIISSEEAIKTLNVILSVLKRGSSDDQRTADKILRKAEKIEALSSDTKTLAAIKMIGAFVIGRQNARYQLSNSFVEYVQDSIRFKKDGGGATEKEGDTKTDDESKEES